MAPSPNNRHRPPSATPTQSDSTKDDFFIPDLCRVQAVFILILLTELVAFLFTLVRPSASGLDWFYLGLISLFGIWNVLSCAAFLCLLRKTLSKMKVTHAATVALALIIGVVFCYSLIAYYFFNFDQENRHDSLFFVRNIAIALIIGGTVLRYFYIDHQRRAQKQSELRAKLEALQSRIRPHFLFNSLNSIASLIMVNPEKAEDAILDLSELFRATLQTEKLLIPIADELEMCQKYLNIEQLRLGDRLQQDWQIEINTSNFTIPPLTLQPLAENAIYHGIQPLEEGGTITIKAYEKDSYVYIMVTNPCPQDSDDKTTEKSTGKKSHQGNQIAYKNTENRILTLFGKSAVLKSSIMEGKYTVTLRIPKNQEWTQ